MQRTMQRTMQYGRREIPNLYNATRLGRSLFSFRALLVKVNELRRTDNCVRIRDKSIESNRTRLSTQFDENLRIRLNACTMEMFIANGFENSTFSGSI